MCNGSRLLSAGFFRQFSARAERGLTANRTVDRSSRNNEQPPLGPVAGPTQIVRS